MHRVGRALCLVTGTDLIVCGFFLLYLYSCGLFIPSLFCKIAGSSNGGLL